MAKCRLCDHPNPAGVERCEKCGTWLDASEGQPASAPPTSDHEAEPSEPAADTLEGKVLEALQAGRKIEAVKLYRAERNVGLKGAKDAVEELAQKHGIVATRSGCAGVLLVLLAIGASAAATF